MYLLDSDTITAIFNNQQNVIAKVKEAPANSIFTSAITIQESLKGALRIVNTLQGNTPSQIASKYDFMLRIIQHTASFPSLSYGENSEAIFRSLPTSIRQAHPQDCRHAAVALTHGYIVVTRNARHFGKIEGLLFENWID